MNGTARKKKTRDNDRVKILRDPMIFHVEDSCAGQSDFHDRICVLCGTNDCQAHFFDDKLREGRALDTVKSRRMLVLLEQLGIHYQHHRFVCSSNSICAYIRIQHTVSLGAHPDVLLLPWWLCFFFA